LCVPTSFPTRRSSDLHWVNPDDNAWLAPKSVITEDDFDWQDDKAPRTPWPETIIYELHVKGFSKLNEAVPVALRGTFAGLADPEDRKSTRLNSSHVSI